MPSVVRLALARRVAALQRGPDLGPRGEALDAGDARARVDDARSRARRRSRRARRSTARSRRRSRATCASCAGFCDCTASSASWASTVASRVTLATEVAPLAALVLHAERHLEREQHEQRDAEVAEQQPAVTAARHAGRSRKPTPRTVSIQAGSPSLRRSAATWTSIVFVEPNQVVCQTSSSSCRRLTAAPGSRASAASRSNSFGVSSSSRAVERRRGACARRPRARRTRSGSCARPCAGCGA